MDKKLIALVVIALLIGLGGGYGLSYVTYQPQIQAIQSDLSDLKDRTSMNQNELGTLNLKVSNL